MVKSCAEMQADFVSGCPGAACQLRRTAELLAPVVDFIWLHEIEQELEWDMRAASKLARIVDSDRIVKAGLDLRRGAATNDKLSPFRLSLQYRNGLIIACPSAQPQ